MREGNTVTEHKTTAASVTLVCFPPAPVTPRASAHRLACSATDIINVNNQHNPQLPIKDTDG